MPDNIPPHLRKQVRDQAAADERPSTAPTDEAASSSTTTELGFENFELSFTAREQAEGQPIEFDLSVVIDRKGAGEPRVTVDVDLGMQNATNVISGLVTSLAQLIKTAADEASTPKDDYEDWLRKLLRGMPTEDLLRMRPRPRPTFGERPARRAPFSSDRPVQRPKLGEDVPTPPKEPGFFERLIDDVFGTASGEAVDELSKRRQGPTVTPAPPKKRDLWGILTEAFGEAFDDEFRRRPR